MLILGTPILHVVDEGTHYSAARFLPDEFTDRCGKRSCCKGYRHIWFYRTHSRLTVDQYSRLRSGKIILLLQAKLGVAVEISPMEGSNSMAIGERYHELLRRIFPKSMGDHLGYSKELVLSLTSKAMNDTCGHERLVPRVLVSGSIPLVPLGSILLSDQEGRMNKLRTAKQEMESVVARLRLREVLKKRAPSAAHSVIIEGDPMLVWFKGKSTRDGRASR